MVQWGKQKQQKKGWGKMTKEKKINKRSGEKEISGNITAHKTLNIVKIEIHLIN